MFARPSKCPLFNCLPAACKLIFQGYRDRKSGPKHPLVRFYCSTHKSYFTVYPIGYVPYGRAPIFLSSGNTDISETLFKAALDASSNISWRKTASIISNMKIDIPLEEIRTFKTQKRHISGAAILLKISSLIDERSIDLNTLSADYGISYMLLKSIRARDGPNTYKKTGVHIMELLKSNQCSLNLQTIIKLGSAAGFFGECQILQGEMKKIYK